MSQIKFFGRSLFGYGGTNRAIAKLSHIFGNWDIFDDNFNCFSKDEWGNNLLPTSCFNPKKSTLEVATPGINPNHFLTQNAKNLMSDYDLFFMAMPKSIWISGTNGKSSTTKMTGRLLNAPIGANIGVPVASMDFSAEFFVLETSSFTLFYTKKAYPMIYALLPISSDHLSWHGDFLEYKNAKLSPLLRMQSPCVAIIPKEFQNEAVVKNTRARVYFYENSVDLAKQFGVEINKINFQEPFLLDSVLAACVSKIVKNSVDYELLNSTNFAPHTLSEHYINGILFVDDSKATNEQSAICAYKRYENRSILGILGGDLKGVDAKNLLSSLSKYDAKFFLIGSSKAHMKAICDELGLKYELCDNLRDAVYKMSFYDKNYIRLLSPACASLDEFKSYKERGELFIKYAFEFSKNN